MRYIFLPFVVTALKINLNIGEVIQSLDVKTMAEQWKAYTVICEKYSSDLRDTDIFQDCSQVLCTLIKDNIETAIEVFQIITFLICYHHQPLTIPLMGFWLIRERTP